MQLKIYKQKVFKISSILNASSGAIFKVMTKESIFQESHLKLSWVPLVQTVLYSIYFLLLFLTLSSIIGHFAQVLNFHAIHKPNICCHSV